MANENTSPSAAAEPTQVNPESASSPAPAAEAPTYVLDASSPDALRASIRNLQRSSPDFANVFGDLAGRTAQRTWDPKVRQLQAELEQERNYRRRLELEQMAPEDIENRFATDPTFATDYAKLVHFKPEPVKVDRTEQIQQDIAENFADLMAWAKDQGLPTEAAQLITNKAANGGYDRDGETLDQWPLAFSRLQQDVTAALLKAGKSTTPPPESTTTVPPTSKVTNPGLTTRKPDLSGGSSGKSNQPMPATAAEFRALPPEVQRELISRDREAVIKLK